jgi:sucrose-6-phosphatase
MTEKKPPFLIVTDLDSTLVGNDEFLERFNNIFTNHCWPNGSKLVYATGRSLQLYQTLRSKLLQPDMLITSVGSEIYTSDREIDSGWTEHISQDWDVDEVRKIAGSYRNLRPQSTSEQGPFKVSFHLEPQHQDVLEDLRQKLQRLQEEKNIGAQVIYSGGKNLDILPKRSGKGNASRYVRAKLGMPPTSTIACGDSGNDISLFDDRDTFGIIVGNARAELKEWYENNGRDNLYLATNNCAEGILEGLRKFRWLGNQE